MDQNDDFKYLAAASTPLHKMWMAYVTVKRALDAKTNRAITLTRYMVLSAIEERPGITQTEIVRYSGRDRSTTATVVAAMSDDDLVRTEKDPNDRRSFKCYITEKGKKLLATVKPIADEINVGLVAAFSSAREKGDNGLDGIIKSSQFDGMLQIGYTPKE